MIYQHLVGVPWKPLELT